MPSVVITIGGESVGESDQVQVNPGQSVQGLLRSVLGRERSDLLGGSQKVVVSGESNVRVRADLSSSVSEIEKKLGETLNDLERVNIRLTPRLEGGVDAPRLTPSAWAKVQAFISVIIAYFRDPNVEFCLLGFGGREDASLISEVFLLRGQRVSSGSFEADPDALELTMGEIRRLGVDLALRAVLHKHPGVQSAYHSHRDDTYILPFLRVVAQLLFRLGGWSRVLEDTCVEDDAVHVRLDEDGRRSVVFSPREHDGEKARERARALLDEFDITLVGADLQAQLYSLVFSRDGDLFARGVIFESIAATTEDGPPAFAQRVLEEDLEVEILDAEPLGVAEAQIGTSTEMESEVRRFVRRYSAIPNNYAGNIAVLPVSAGGEDSSGNGAGSYEAHASDTPDSGSILAKLKVAGQALALAGKAVLELTESLGSDDSSRPATRGEN